MISRRDFLKASGVAALAVAAVGMTGCSTTTLPGNGGTADAPASSGTTATNNTVTLADGVTLTILGTERKNVLPNGTKQYMAIKFKLTNKSKKDVTLTETNFKSNVNGVWEYPVSSAELSDSQKEFLFDTCDTPYISYYKEEFDQAFGAAGTALEAAVCYMTNTAAESMDLIVTYGSNVYKFALKI